MKFKKGVKIIGVKNEIMLAIMVANAIYLKHGQDLVVTEITGGRHGNGSLHYAGQAFDLRTRFFSESEAKLVTDEIRDALTDEFDVILEKDHIHIEWQVKQP